MVIDEENFYLMLTSEDEFDVNLGLTMINHYRGNNKKLNELIAFYKQVRKLGWPTTLRYKMMDLRNTHVTILPENLWVEHDLWIGNSLKKLPNNLTVRTLNLVKGCRVSEIPKNLNVTARFNLKESNLGKDIKYEQKLKKEIERLGGSWGEEYTQSWGKRPITLKTFYTDLESKENE